MKKTTRNGALLCAGLVAVTPLALAMARTQSAVDDAALTARGRAVVVDVLANDPGMAAPQVLSIRTQPQHGTAQVVDGAIRYVPAPGFTGRDRFTYLVKKGRGLGLATVRVDVGEALVLRGRVTDSPIANATVGASVGGHHFTAQADGNGDYALEIIGLGGGMVTLGAQGTGKQSAVNFLSVLGDFDRVLAEAGADGELTRDENNQVQVTNVSTAQAYLLQLANDGAPVTSDEELAIAREALDNGQLLTMAAAIRLSVDGGYPLPAGTPDTLALISDPDALEAFLGTVESDDPEALAQTINAIVSDPSLIVQSDASDLLGTYTLAYHLGVPGTVNTGNIQGERLTLAADGSGAFVGSVPNHDPSVEWSFDEGTGRAVAIPSSPIVQRTYPTIEGIGQVPMDMSVTRIEVAKLFDGDGRDTLALTRTVTYSYPDNPELEGGTTTSSGVNIGIRDETGILPFTAGELAGSSRSLWISGVPYSGSNFSGSEMFSFDADGSGVRGDGVSFEWSIDPLGRLQVDYADGTGSTYGRVQSDGRKGEGLAAEWRAANGDRSAALSISAIGDGFAFTSASAAGDWRSGQFVSRVSFEDHNTDFFMVFGPGQAGWHVSYSTTEAWPTAIGWGVNGGMVDAIYYRDGANQPVHSCQVGVAGCYIYQIRRWRPVAMDGNRAYVIEEFLVDFEGDGTFDVITQRGNFYDATPALPFRAARRPATPERVRAPGRR